MGVAQAFSAVDCGAGSWVMAGSDSGSGDCAVGFGTRGAPPRREAAPER